MSMSVSFHSNHERGNQFEVKGSATRNSFSNEPYPVLNIESRGSEGFKQISLFLNAEQLIQLRNAIGNALRDYNKLKLNMEIDKPDNK